MSPEILAEFVVFGSPVSQQTRRRQRVRDWIGLVAAAARAELPSGPDHRDRPARVEITCYYGRTDLDIDNVPKPVLDGIKGIVLVDDIEVVDLVVRKRRLGWADGRADLPGRVARALAAKVEFMHVVVEAYASEDELG